MDHMFEKFEDKNVFSSKAMDIRRSNRPIIDIIGKIYVTATIIHLFIHSIMYKLSLL